MHPQAEEDRIDVWQIALAQPAPVPARLASLLSPAERTRAASFLYPRDRDRFVAAHGALRAILAVHVESTPAALVFHEGPNGKPFLAGHPVHFNLTHAGDLALLAISPMRRLGIDLEPLRDLPDALAIAEQFHPAEQAALRASHPDPRAFFECWTRKEAFVKATGEGLGRPLDSFEVAFGRQPAALVDQPAWHLFNLDIPGHAAALVAERLNQPSPGIYLQTWSPGLSA